MRVYNGENLKGRTAKLKSLDEYKSESDVNEGFYGLSTRFAFKILAKTFNLRSNEIAACVPDLLAVLKDQVKSEQFEGEDDDYYNLTINGLIDRYRDFLEKELKKSYVESYGEYGQNLFDRYVTYADSFLNSEDHRDKITGELMDLDALEEFLDSIEKAAGIVNTKDFRQEIVNFCLRYRSTHKGNNPKWTVYAKMRDVIEKKLFANMDDILPIISFTKKATKDQQAKHNKFVKRMEANGYTASQIKRSVEWYQKYSRK